LVSSDTSLAELVEISEEFLNTDAFHNNDGTDSVLNISGVAGDINLGLSETVVKNINIGSGLVEEGVLLGAMVTMVVVRDGPVGLGVEVGTGSLGIVFREDVFSTVNVLAEVVVVDLLSVSKIAVFTCEESELGSGRGHEAEGLQNTHELVSGNVLRLSSIEIMEARLEQNSLGGDLISESIEHVHNLSLLILVEKSLTLSFLNNSGGVGQVRENVVNVVNESAVLDKSRLSLDSVFVDKVVNFGSIKLNIQSTNTGAELNRNTVSKFKPITYSSFTDPSFTELIEIKEELFNSNSVLGSQSL
jgi:hypothetical protein